MYMPAMTLSEKEVGTSDTFLVLDFIVVLKYVLLFVNSTTEMSTEQDR